MGPAPDARRGTLVALLVTFAVFGLGVVLSAHLLLGGRLLPAGDRVAIVPLRGAIVDERAFLDELERFRDDGSVRAFVIEIESPGGAVGASQSIYEAIRDLREEDDRPVLAWLGDVGASGGYYAAVAADSVFALPGTITGSIGVILEFPNARELLRKVGLEWEIVKSGEHKDLGTPTRSLSETDREILQGLVQDVHEQFVGAVTENRPIAAESVGTIADGRVFSGRQAVELGLIDGLRTLAETVELAGGMVGLGPDPSTVRPERRTPNLLDLLSGFFGAEARGLLTTWTPMHSGTPRLLYEWR